VRALALAASGLIWAGVAQPSPQASLVSCFIGHVVRADTVRTPEGLKVAMLILAHAEVAVGDSVGVPESPDVLVCTAQERE